MCCAVLCCAVVLACSGTITVDEMREGLRAKDTKIPEAELELIMANADVNGDGKVDYEEFLAATMHLGKLEREEHLYRAFKVCRTGGRQWAETALHAAGCAESAFVCSHCVWAGSLEGSAWLVSVSCKSVLC
jgi:hypothetical protein